MGGGRGSSIPERQVQRKAQAAPELLSLALPNGSMVNPPNSSGFLELNWLCLGCPYLAQPLRHELRVVLAIAARGEPIPNHSKHWQPHFLAGGRLAAPLSERDRPRTHLAGT